jgi:hypothetical protein
MVWCTDYPAARKALAEMMLPASSPAAVEQGQLTGMRPGRFGVAATLYAMASASSCDVEVVDLSNPELRFPSTSMQLVPLWKGPLERSLGNFILSTPAVSVILEQSGGWNRRAYERLRCGTSALEAQFLSPPAVGGGSAPEEIVKQREQDILQMINRYLYRVGPLGPDEPVLG